MFKHSASKKLAKAGGTSERGGPFLTDIFYMRAHPNTLAIGKNKFNKGTQ